MTASLISLITERPWYDSKEATLVAFGESARLLDVHPRLVQAADIVQARWWWSPFLIEACESVTAAEVLAVPDTFEVSLGSGLFCVPFDKRDRLSDSHFHLSDMSTYARVVSLLSGELEVGLDGLWEYLYREVGFPTFRLILSEIP